MSTFDIQSVLYFLNSVSVFLSLCLSHVLCFLSKLSIEPSFYFYYYPAELVVFVKLPHVTLYKYRIGAFLSLSGYLLPTVINSSSKVLVNS